MLAEEQTAAVRDGGLAWSRVCPLALGRLDLSGARLMRRVTAAATVTALSAAAALVGRGESLAGWQERRSWVDLALETTLTVGALLGVVGTCLLVGARATAGPGPLRAGGRLLATAGTMPLTIYVTHALLSPFSPPCWTPT